MTMTEQIDGSRMHSDNTEEDKFSEEEIMKIIEEIVKDLVEKYGEE